MGWPRSASILALVAMACSSGTATHTGTGTGTGTGAGAGAGDLPGGTSCEPLAAPTGAVIRVDPSQAADLPAIAAGAASGTTILLADGTYDVHRIDLTTPGVTLRSASGNPAAVVIDGGYATDTDEMLAVSASDVTIAEITITHAWYHPIHVSPRAAGPDVTGVRLYRLRLLDGGEQLVKVNPNSARSAFVDGGRLECSALAITDAGRPKVISTGGMGCYTGGIDAHAARGWVVRGNRFEGIWCPTDLAEHAVHFWSGSRDTLVEDNLIVNCGRGIGFGLTAADDAMRSYADDPYPGVGYIGHYGGIIRNNAIFADITGFDSGIALAQARGARVYHNTVYSTGGFSSIEYRFANTLAEIRNNLTRNIVPRDGATATLEANLEGVPASYFVDAAGGDLHLSATATGAIDQGVVVPDPGLDLDGNPRGASPDLGAYEYQP